ncbi:hypothetical protein Tco_1018296 [Tanacetum coccineum]|uniref:Uncharacterized protein n=1 Tax=Tanacetum coccineum TaxID=301880 RepID=A0ABQ5FTX9_9ASTR
MVESLPTMVDKHIKEQVEKQVPKQVKVQVPVYVAKGLFLERQQNKEETDKMIAKAITSVVRPRDQEDPHGDAHLMREKSAKRQKTSEYEAYMTGESSRQVNEKEQDDDEILTKQVSQYIIEEVSLTINEAELKKITNEMLRQRCTLGDEHQYHIAQMKNFLKSDIVWESRKEILASPHPQKTTPLVQSCQRDPEASALSLINQDLLYLKKGNSGPEKIKEPRKPKEVVYSNSKIIQVIKTYWELGFEHKFITEIVARRANECIVLITKPNYKNLNKNDIEDMYFLIMNGKVVDIPSLRKDIYIVVPESFSPGLKLVLLNIITDFRVVIFSIFALLLTSRIVVCSLLSSKRSRLISKALSFCTMSISAVLEVSMPISTRIIASVLYGKVEKGVILLL